MVKRYGARMEFSIKHWLVLMAGTALQLHGVAGRRLADSDPGTWQWHLP